MATKTWSKIFNGPNYILVFFFFFALTTEFRYSNCNENVDKLTEKSWPLK